MSDESCPLCGRSDGVGWVLRWDPKTGKMRKRGEHVTCPKTGEQEKAAG